MIAFLWTITILGVLEMAGTLWVVLDGKVPERTPGGVAINAVAMFSLAMWAFWLLAHQ